MFDSLASHLARMHDSFILFFPWHGLHCILCNLFGGRSVAKVRALAISSLKLRRLINI